MSIYRIATNLVPARFQAGLETEYGTAATEWLKHLPQLLETWCARWELHLSDPTPRHGYLSLIWKVVRQSEPYALKLTLPTESFRCEIAGLAIWNGSGMVRLYEASVDDGVALLQWLDSSVSLADIPITEAIAASGKILRNAPTMNPEVNSRFANVAHELQQSSQHWPDRNRSFGNPLSSNAIIAGQAAVARIRDQVEINQQRLVNHDLHYDNVIRDWNGNWVCIDPKPVIGSPEYAIAPLIWQRYSSPESAIKRTQHLCAIAHLDEALALDWLLIRVIEYLFWGIGAGLTDDPTVCREIIDHLV